MKKKKKEGIWGLLQGGEGEGDEEGGVDVSLGNVVRLMLFTHKKESQVSKSRLYVIFT